MPTNRTKLLRRFTMPLSGVSVSFVALLAATGFAQAEKPKGAALFAKRCASCHGSKGQGAASYPKALAGDKTPQELAKFLARVMPPKPAKPVSAAEATQIAVFMHETFYSPVAQARNRPARVDLSRLTVSQMRYTLADLVGTFRPPIRFDTRRGLRGEYYKSGRMRPADRVLDRIDPGLRFDFGDKPAVEGQPDPYDFSMRWTGSIIAPDTGEYEFIVRTEHAFRLWINDMRQPLIDATVQSGSDTEYRGVRFLLAGRAYPLRLEFQKGVTGVENLAVLKRKPPQPATLALLWRPPKLPPEVVPARFLMPVQVTESFAPETPFPPDDRSMGYERGTSVSRAWDEATTEAAIETAGYVAFHLRELSGAPETGNDRDAALRRFCRRFAERAVRRPLSKEQEDAFVEKPFQRAGGGEEAVKRCMLAVLKSPSFLYREAERAGDAYETASKLSYGMWDTLPDEELLRAAAAGELATEAQIRRQVERMQSDPRAWAKLRGFFYQWLRLDQTPELVKDAKQFPGFDASVASDLRTSLDLFLEETVWSERSDFRALLLSETAPMNGRLSKIYGVNLPADAPFQPVVLSGQARAGVLTHPYLMANLAYLASSSPIHRGVLVARNILGRVLRPPQEAVAPLAASLHPGMTTRERVAMQTRPEACMTCHQMINPLGFPFENFDAIGRFQTTENGKRIDATGTYTNSVGKVVRFAGARDLATYVAESKEGRTAFAERLFHYLIRQPLRAHGPDASGELVRGFEDSNLNIRKLMADSVALAAKSR